MKLLLFTLPVLFFSLISTAADAKTQLQNLSQTVNAATSPRGPASDETDETAVEDSRSLSEAQVFYNPADRSSDMARFQQKPMLRDADTAFRPTSKPVKKKKSAPVVNSSSEGVGTGQ